MNRDVINEHYYGDPTEPTTERARERIHWICNQAKGQDVLDIGCSQGIVCLILGREGFRCTGIDIESASLAVGEQALAAEDELLRQRVTFQVADASKLPFPNECFDTVILGEIIEHLAHPSKVLTQAKRVLRQGGRVIVTVPYGLNAFPDHKRTYYPISLLELLQPLFRTSIIETLGNYIVYTGLKDPAYDDAGVGKEALFEQYLQLEKTLEERCLSKERQLLETATKLYAQIRTLTGQSAEQAKKITELEETVASKEKVTREVASGLKQERASGIELREQAARARAESAAQTERITHLEQAVTAKDCRIQELEVAAEQRIGSIAALNEQVIRAAAESTAQASKQRELQEAIVAKEKRIVDLEKSVQETRASLAALREGAVRADMETKAKSSRMKELQDALASKENRILDFERIAEQTRTSVAALRESALRAESESTAQAARIKESHEAIAAKDKTIKDLETRIEQANASIASLREETIRAEADANTQALRLRQSEESSTAKDSQMISLRHSLEQELNAAAALGAEISRSSATQTRLQTEAKALEQRVVGLQSENAALKRDLEAKDRTWKQQLARTEAQHTARVRERDKQQEDLLARREAEWKRKLVNQRIRETARVALPPEASVLVISKGDDDLLNLDGRYGQHFPQTAGGVYAGHHPANATEAIKHLEILKAKGAEFLLVPSTSMWWLEFYSDFRRHLETQYRLFSYNEDCLIFALRPPPPRNGHLELAFQQTTSTGLRAEDKSNGGPAIAAVVTTVPSGSAATCGSETSARSVSHSPEVKATPGRPAVILLEAPPSAGIATQDVEQKTAKVNVSAVQSGARKKNVKTLTVGCILDEFTAACFAPECSLVTFRPDNWENVLERSPIDMLFVESAWRGNEGAWQYKIVSVPKGHELDDLIKYCRSKNIPTVFWNKEDPVHFDRFIKSASLFDYVFTTDSDCVPRYRENLQHDRISALPFAAQATLHHPVLETERLHNVCFAGAYYGLSHDERRKDMDLILKPALEYGLHIFDRQHGMVGPAADQYRFPAIYQPAIKGYLSYDQLVKAYKRYRVFMNVNSVKTSPTMFSRRIFELLACGTPVISAYARGIENLLGSDIVAFSGSEEETKKHLDRLLGNDSEWARASARGIRAVFDRHTYAERWQTLCQKVDPGLASTTPKTVTVIAAVNRETTLLRFIDMLVQQTYRHFGVWLFLGKGVSAKVAEQLSNALPGIRVKVFPETAEVAAACTNTEAGDYLWLIQPTDFYGPNFLKDCMLASTYSDAEFIGKHSHFVVSKNQTKLELISQGYEYKYVNSLPPGSFVAKRGSLTEQSWSGLLQRQTLQATQRRVLSIDPFNYVRNAYPVPDKGVGCPSNVLKEALV
jgi:spore maturation protein CgeB/SAM-dependent methyltransferase